MQTLEIIAFIASFFGIFSSLLMINHYTVMIRKMQNGETYKGFMKEIFWPLTLQSGGVMSVECLPYFYWTKFDDPEMEKARKSRNLWIYLCWVSVALITISIVLTERNSEASEDIPY